MPKDYRGHRVYPSWSVVCESSAIEGCVDKLGQLIPKINLIRHEDPVYHLEVPSCAWYEGVRLWPIFGQKKHQDFWEQATVPCPEDIMLAVHKRGEDFKCVPTAREACIENGDIIVSLHHDKVTFRKADLDLADNEQAASPDSIQEVQSIIDALNADVVLYEAFLTYTQPDEEQPFLTLGPAIVEAKPPLPTSLTVQNMLQGLALDEIEARRDVASDLFKRALGDELMALAQAYPSVPIPPQDVGKSD